MNLKPDGFTKKEKDEYYRQCNKVIHRIDRKLRIARDEEELGVKNEVLREMPLLGCGWRDDGASNL